MTTTDTTPQPRDDGGRSDTRRTVVYLAFIGAAVAAVVVVVNVIGAGVILAVTAVVVAVESIAIRSAVLDYQEARLELDGIGQRILVGHRTALVRAARRARWYSRGLLLYGRAQLRHRAARRAVASDTAFHPSAVPALGPAPAATDGVEGRRSA